MKIKLVSFGYTNELFKDCMQVRHSVFVEELGWDPQIDFDVMDEKAAHFLLSVDEQPVGAARWIETEEGVKIERLSIIKEFRGLGLGHLLLRYVLDDLKPSKKPIYLHSPENLVDFFIWNGFKTEGGKFEQNGQNYYKMLYVKNTTERRKNKGLLKIFGKGKSEK